MIFNKIIEESNINTCKSTIDREAVRAIIMINSEILLVQSNRGDYKFPGGGLETNESHSIGLIREVKEETGYINCVVKDKAGMIIERKVDEYDRKVMFQMTSHYYHCELRNEEKISQQLDDYESALNFAPTWVNLDEAIKQNEKLMNGCQRNSWLKRETYVLNELKKMFANKN